MSKSNKIKISKAIFIPILCCLIGIFSVMVPVVQAKSSVKLNYSKATILKNETLKLKLSGNTEKIKWSSSDTNVAKVSKNGKVTAKSTGTAKITAKVNSKKYTCKIKVENPKVYAKNYTMKRGTKIQLSVADTTLPIKWKSKDPSFAKVNSNGVVTAVSTGMTTVTAKVSKKVFKFKIGVTEGVGFSSDGELIVLD
ncbi:MAG: Ig-like domain-containing protein [Ruminococcus sp.]